MEFEARSRTRGLLNSRTPAVIPLAQPLAAVKLYFTVSMSPGAKVSAAFLAFVGVAFVQLGAPRVDLRALLEADAVHAGSIVRAAVEVRLPKGYHVNSNQPLDKYLIPTSLSLELPEVVTLRETVYPDAINLTLEWSEKPLAVYEETFFIGVSLELGESLALGKHVIDGRLRYQACDDKRCFRPETVDAELELQVVSKDRKPIPQNTDVLESIAFREH